MKLIPDGKRYYIFVFIGLFGILLCQQMIFPVCMKIHVHINLLKNLELQEKQLAATIGHEKNLIKKGR